MFDFSIFRGGYDRAKVNVLKSILTCIIILHHLAPMGFDDLKTIALFGNFVMWLFFAMSGYGLVYSYIKNENYIDGFLKRSLLKLFIPYFIALVAFVVYRFIEGIDQFELFKTKGLYSFVPTSWYIYVLGYFYVFYFVIFRYCKKNMTVKVLLLCCSIFAYCFIAPRIGVESWRYNRCPGFCIGALMALANSTIIERFNKKHIFCLLSMLFIATCFILKFSMVKLFSPVVYSMALLFLFLSMYLFDLPKCLKESKIINFISSISLEMFIIQYIALYVVVDDLAIKSTWFAIVLVFVIDIACAYLMNFMVKRIRQMFVYPQKCSK